MIDPPGHEPLRLSNSKAKTWRRCPNQFRYKYELGLRTKGRSIYLERGSWLHTLMEVYYSADPGLQIKVGKKWFEVGTDWRLAHKHMHRAFNNLFEEEKEDLGDLPTECMRIFTSYLMRYGKQDAKQWKVIDAELDEIITLPSGLRFQVIIDLIVEEPDGGLWIVDHKTVGRFMAVDFMLLDSQLARYFWCAEDMGYKNLRGILFNEVNTTAPTLPKVLQDGTLEKRANLRCDVYTYMREIKRQGTTVDAHREFLRRLASQQDMWFRRTRLPKDPVLTARLMTELEWTADEIRTAQANQAFPRSPEKECTFMCEYLHMCQVELNGGDISDIIKSRFTTKEERDL